MPQTLFQGIVNVQNKPLLIVEQFAIYLDLASNVRGMGLRSLGAGPLRGSSDKETGGL